jgi:hypothetical protein
MGSYHKIKVPIFDEQIAQLVGKFVQDVDRPNSRNCPPLPLNPLPPGAFSFSVAHGSESRIISQSEALKAHFGDDYFSALVSDSTKQEDHVTDSLIITRFLKITNHRCLEKLCSNSEIVRQMKVMAGVGSLTASDIYMVTAVRSIYTGKRGGIIESATEQIRQKIKARAPMNEILNLAIVRSILNLDFGASYDRTIKREFTSDKWIEGEICFEVQYEIVSLNETHATRRGDYAISLSSTAFGKKVSNTIKRAFGKDPNTVELTVAVTPHLVRYPTDPSNYSIDVIFVGGPESVGRIWIPAGSGTSKPKCPENKLTWKAKHFWPILLMESPTSLKSIRISVLDCDLRVDEEVSHGIEMSARQLIFELRIHYDQLEDVHHQTYLSSLINRKKRYSLLTRLGE